MSTKGSIYYLSSEDDQEHNLEIHIHTDMHESDDTLCVSLSCSYCNCHYDFLMSNHLGMQLAEKLKRLDELESKILEENGDF